MKARETKDRKEGSPKNKHSKTPSKQTTSRTDWEQNHARIRDAMLALIDEKRGKIPSQFEIADKTGLSRPTVQRHLKERELSQITKPFRVLADTVLLGLANKAVKGDTTAAKLYFKLTFGKEIGEE